MLGPITVSAAGGAGVYTDDNPGLALRLAVSLDINMFDLVKIKAAGELRLNTSNADAQPRRRRRSARSRSGSR